jgi:hypothetical protein
MNIPLKPLPNPVRSGKLNRVAKNRKLTEAGTHPAVHFLGCINW